MKRIIQPICIVALRAGSAVAVAQSASYPGPSSKAGLAGYAVFP